MSAKLFTGCVIVLGMMSAAAVLADEVSLSHLVVTVESVDIVQNIDAPTVERFCGDSDGCLIVFRLERDDIAATWTARFFVNVGEANRWFSSDSPGYLFDTDGSADLVSGLSRPPNTCVITDGDVAHGALDQSQGFLLGILGGVMNPATCTVTVSD